MIETLTHYLVGVSLRPKKWKTWLFSVSYTASVEWWENFASLNFNFCVHVSSQFLVMIQECKQGEEAHQSWKTKTHQRCTFHLMLPCRTNASTNIGLSCPACSSLLHRLFIFTFIYLQRNGDCKTNPSEGRRSEQTIVEPEYPCDDGEKQKKWKINNLSFLSVDDRNRDLWRNERSERNERKMSWKKKKTTAEHETEMGWVRAILSNLISKMSGKMHSRMNRCSNNIRCEQLLKNESWITCSSLPAAVAGSRQSIESSREVEWERVTCVAKPAFWWGGISPLHRRNIK